MKSRVNKYYITSIISFTKIGGSWVQDKIKSKTIRYKHLHISSVKKPKSLYLILRLKCILK